MVALQPMSQRQASRNVGKLKTLLQRHVYPRSVQRSICRCIQHAASHVHPAYLDPDLIRLSSPATKTPGHNCTPSHCACNNNSSIARWLKSALPVSCTPNTCNISGPFPSHHQQTTTTCMPSNTIPRLNTCRAVSSCHDCAGCG